jgi:hypothetical protein
VSSTNSSRKSHSATVVYSYNYLQHRRIIVRSVSIAPFLFTGTLETSLAVRVGDFLKCNHHHIIMFLILYMLRRTPSEVHDPNTTKRYGLILFLNMAALVISVILDVLMACIIIDSFGPNGSYISTYFSHNDALMHILGQLLVRTLAVTAAVTSLIVCCLISPEKIDMDRQ